MLAWYDNEWGYSTPPRRARRARAGARSRLSARRRDQRPRGELPGRRVTSPNGRRARSSPLRSPRGSSRSRRRGTRRRTCRSPCSSRGRTRRARPAGPGLSTALSGQTPKQLSQEKQLPQDRQRRASYSAESLVEALDDLLEGALAADVLEQRATAARRVGVVPGVQLVEARELAPRLARAPRRRPASRRCSGRPGGRGRSRPRPCARRGSCRRPRRRPRWPVIMRSSTCDDAVLDAHPGQALEQRQVRRSGRARGSRLSASSSSNSPVGCGHRRPRRGSMRSIRRRAPPRGAGARRPRSSRASGRRSPPARPAAAPRGGRASARACAGRRSPARLPVRRRALRAASSAVSPPP